ncbi:MAG: class I SAM-dependent methyltransferase [Erysipelotrichaceae bacterium]|nr:class I SAM-dependent methyltransferase [Erysipelotrichaceae bacterium]
MKANYHNWVPKEMAVGFAAASAALAAADIGLQVFGKDLPKGVRNIGGAALLAGALGCGAFGAWCFYARSQFSYEGERKLSKQIVEGTAEHITLPEGGVGLDVGCGSGALTIAVAKRNPQGRMIGVDPWGIEYPDFNKKTCEENAEAEGVGNVSFESGDACRLPFEDESFDAVTSNYVYHNITGHNKQKLLKETLRVLKKGGTFAIHDLMSNVRYGDMEKFCEELRREGYEEVELIDTTDGMFMDRKEAALMMLKGSKLLKGKK